LSKKNDEIEIYETNHLSDDKKELQKEVLQLRKEKDERKNKSSSFYKIIIYLLLIGILGLVLLFANQKIVNNNSNNPNQLQEQGKYQQQTTAISSDLGKEPIEVNESKTINGLELTVDQITYKPTKTMIVLKAKNLTSESMHLMAQQKSSLIDQNGTNYKIDPFDSDNNLTGNLPANSTEYSNLVFETVDKSAEELTYTLSVLGNSSGESWEQSISFKVD
jgi:hypothetical protein